jgi:OHCU decarboxylase
VKLTLSLINQMSEAEFIGAVGMVFEHSPWIAEVAWGKRPFRDVTELHGAMCGVVRDAGVEKQLALIRAHPDLAGEAARRGTLTRASAGEQDSAGLAALSAEEIELFQKQNAAYKAKFGFPFVICARQNKKAAILAGFERRLQNSRDTEIKTALEEIYKIGELRLRDLIPN